MQDDDLFAKRPPDNKHRFDQHHQVGEVLNKLPDAGLCAKCRAGHSRLRSTSTVAACDVSAASAVSDCVSSSRAPDDKAPPASLQADGETRSVNTASSTQHPNFQLSTS